MDEKGFRNRLMAGEPLAGTFMKTASVDVLEVLILAGLDFVCLDAEHAPFDRAALNSLCAVARAARFPLLVRVPSGSAEQIGMALDAGADGIVVPHVTDAATAARVARAARFGPGGRGYAGSTRWAGYATRSMPELLAMTADTLVIAQIEDPEAVEAVEEIAATDGIDALFLGPADLTVGYGHAAQDNDDVARAYARTGAAARGAGRAFMTFVADAARARALHAEHGVTVFFIASEHVWMLQGAREAVAGIRDIG
ncbi:aldolase/citrate lyase family protein [Roseibacterium sp. SDUM158017]|uniref:HpcH/HpaI aldolase family protein n=1 Tax=Roseicyclus salinarum TaxID=3036773 RepID=UPI0024156BA7|nr:aldolase/citrate lyase family protein [Roseibacterium sp. SDUM158017]MDG4648124.1 aldolase/citrate lyase family protein [Roseibacterium sp. SDUM158017]